MSGDLTARDGLVQQLMDVLMAELTAEDAARAVLRSGLVVPTSDVLDLIDKMEGHGEPLWLTEEAVAELRALTQQEPR